MPTSAALPALQIWYQILLDSIKFPTFARVEKPCQHEWYTP